jgi:phospholipid/cholesterol/gamma-HCH transport system permease protein
LTANSEGAGLSPEPSLKSIVTGDRLEVVAAGPWTTAHAERLEKLVEPIPSAGAGSLAIDVAGIDELDTLGAWLLERLIRGCEKRGREVRLVGLPPRYRDLFDEVHRTGGHARKESPRDNRLFASVVAVGRSLADVGFALRAFAEMLGALANALVRVLFRPRTFRLTSAVHHLDRVGLQAVPIIVLITFLIGGIIAQQGIFHFRKLGAEDYVVDLVGILVLREIGVLIVAIMVAGRSGSSYTAEIGSMKMREEIDALRVIGLDPVEVLMLPRVVALIVALPILAFLGSMSALAGGGLVSWLYGGMSPATYVARVRDAIAVTHFEVGMVKAPFMALIIGVVACFKGLEVKGSAESLGLQTTASVVTSIFLVIVLDGLFAIFFASVGM